MNIYRGIGNSKGIATAKIMLYNRHQGQPKIRYITDCESEKSRFRLAKYIAIKELALLYEKAYAELGESAAMIFYIHQMMLEDDTFTDRVCSFIDSEKLCSESAVYNTCVELAGIFDNVDDNYISQRRTDVFDVCERVILILKNESRSFPIISEPSIITTYELAPSELLLPKRELIAGIVLFGGSSNSHTSILADKMGIPMLTALDASYESIPDGSVASIDSVNGTLTF